MEAPEDFLDVISSWELSADGTRAALGTHSGDVLVIDLAQPQRWQLNVAQERAGTIMAEWDRACRCLRFDPISGDLLTLSGSSVMSRWDLSGEEVKEVWLQVVSRRKGESTIFDFTTDGQRIVTANRSTGEIGLLDRMGQSLASLLVSRNSRFTRLQVGAEDKVLLGMSHGEVHVYQVSGDGMALLTSFRGHELPPSLLHYDPDSGMVESEDPSGRAFRWPLYPEGEAAGWKWHYRCQACYPQARNLDLAWGLAFR